MDPLAIATHNGPNESGFIQLDGSTQLHYELYKPAGGSSESSSKSPMLMVMGAFATKLHFAELARYISDTSGHDVCIYDHRGVGRSSSPVLTAQTAAQLAADGLVVADALWGAETPIHVYGASMGGMVSQELALLLLPQHRLLSLSLSITCRGMRPMYGLLSPIFTPQVLKRFFELWFWDTKPNLVRRLMRLLLTRQFMQSMHPCGQTYEEVYSRVWLEHFDVLWTFNTHAAGACHAHVCLHHYLTDQQINTIRDSGVPIVCQVSTHDNLIPASMQFELADKLRARTVTIPTGHMGFLPWKDCYHNMLLDQLAIGEAVKGVKAAERARMCRAAAAAMTAAGVSSGAGFGSLMESLKKPVLSALSNLSSSGGSIGGSSGGSSSGGGSLIPSALAPPSTTPRSSAAVSAEASLDLADLEAEQAYDVMFEGTNDVTDMSVVLDDDTPEHESGKAAEGASGVIAAILKAVNGA